MRVLVLGGTGLISTGITRELLERGHDVLHFNRGLSPGQFPGSVRTVRGDRDSRADLGATLDYGDVDAVVDMICYTSEQAAIAVDVFAGRVGQYVMCSTVDVYTKPAAFLPVTESHPRVPAASFPYAFAKQQAEEVLWEAHRCRRLAVTVLRPGATYAASGGAPLGDFPLLVHRLRHGRPVIVHGDGSSIWVVCHRDDVAHAFVTSLHNPAAIGRAYNVTGEELLTWNAYLRTVADAVAGAPPVFVHIPTDTLIRAAPRLAAWTWTNFQYNNIFDNQTARRDLGFRPTTTWAQAVAGFDFDDLPVPNADLLVAYDALVEEWERATTAFVAAMPENAVR